MHCMLNRIACTCMKIVVASSQKMSNISVLIAIGNMHVVKGRNQLSHESTPSTSVVTLGCPFEQHTVSGCLVAHQI